MESENIKILFQDESLTVCVKPVGILSEDSPKEKGIIGILSDISGKPLHLLHRLDRNVGGVMVFANNKKSASVLSQAIAQNELKKEYLLVCDGCPEEKEGVFEDLLFKDSSKNRSYVVKRMRKGVKSASLEYKVLDTVNGKSLVKVLLHTGRTHQIRVQFSSRKLCLCGDIKYGSRDKKSSSIALFSHKITFCHPVTREALTFESEPDFEAYPWYIFKGE